MSAAVNAFSIDVEDWFQVAAFDACIDRASWDSRELRVERNVDRMLEALERRRVRATFFTLGWIAERAPAMVRRIAGAGHELASHGFDHQRVHRLSPEQFRTDVLRAKSILEDVAGTPIVGYRAPSFSIDQRTPWAHEILGATGHRYSSSIYPIRHDLYGMPDAPRQPHRREGGILEIPATTLKIASRNVPVSGGGFFRLLPYPVSRAGLARVNRAEGRSAVFYCHPWEIDPTQPRVPGAPLKSRFRHYVNQRSMLDKLERLLGDFRWDTVENVFLNGTDRPAAGATLAAAGSLAVGSVSG